MLNGAGFTYDRVAHLWLVDVATGEASPADRRPGRPTTRRPGRPTARGSPSRRTGAATPDLLRRSDIHVVDVDDAGRHRGHRAGRGRCSSLPTWLPDGRTIAALGHRLEGRAGSRNDVWLFAADGSDATPTGGRNLSARARPDARLAG